MYKKKKPKLVGDSLNQILKKYGLFDKIKEHSMFIIWNEEVGQSISLHAQPVFFKQGKLFVTVDNSVWVNELKFLKEQIKEKINKRLGMNKIKEIYFKVGGL